MRARSSLTLFSSLLLATTLAHAADNSPALRDRLKAAAALSSLDDSALKPWHWQVDVTLFDKDGKNPSPGTLEMWFSGDKMLMHYSLRSEQGTVLRIADKLYRTPGETKQLPLAVFLELQLIHPIPDEVFAPTVAERLLKQNAGKVKVDSIAPTLVAQTNETVSRDQPFSFVLEPGSPRLLMTSENGWLRIVRRSLGMFQAHEVATDLVVYTNTTTSEEAKTVKLEGMAPDAQAFETSPDMTPFSEPIQVSSGVAGTMVLSQSPPSYPVEAKARNAQGTVVFDAIIGRDGHVESLQQVGTADPALTKEADRTIKTWIYRPFLVNGIPVEVKTQIHMNFTFG